jgi:hypothetical protein
MHRAFTILTILTVTLSCGLFLQAQAQTSPAPAAQPEEQPPVLAVPKDYHYHAQGRRDPFVNPLPKPKQPVAATRQSRPPGLKGVAVDEAQIAGVVTSREPTMNVVIISAPGVKTPFFAHVGDELYDARVKSIKLDTVTFATTAPKGEEGKTPKEIVRKVRPKPGDDK